MASRFVPLIPLKLQLSEVPISGENKIALLITRKPTPRNIRTLRIPLRYFSLYFLPRTSEGSYIPLLPLGTYDLDILFITGHANHVEEYLNKYIKTIPETIIVATTCLPQNLKKYTNQKQIYVPDIDGQYCYYHDGKPYGFRFNPTDSELNFYNSTGDILSRIKMDTDY